MCKTPHIIPFHPGPPLKSCLRPCRSCHGDSNDGQGTKGKEISRTPPSCQTSTGSQTAKVRFPQDSVDTVIRESAGVTMETILRRAGTVFRLASESIAGGDAAVLAVDAGSGADHDGAFRTADPITAVTAGRLQTDTRLQPRASKRSVLSYRRKRRQSVGGKTLTVPKYPTRRWFQIGASTSESRSDTSRLGVLSALLVSRWSSSLSQLRCRFLQRWQEHQIWRVVYRVNRNAT